MWIYPHADSLSLRVCDRVKSYYKIGRSSVHRCAPKVCGHFPMRFTNNVDQGLSNQVRTHDLSLALISATWPKLHCAFAAAFDTFKVYATNITYEIIRFDSIHYCSIGNILMAKPRFNTHNSKCQYLCACVISDGIRAQLILQLTNTTYAALMVHI